MPLVSPTSSKYKAEGLVTLLIGEEKEKLLAHGHRLTKTSEFFNAALKKEWKEGQTRIVELPEEDVKYTTFYLDYIYDGVLPGQSLKEGDVGVDLWFELTFLYAFGERVCDTAIRNAIIKELIRVIPRKDHDGLYRYPCWEFASVAYAVTKPGSPLRRYMVDVIVTHGGLEWFTETDLANCQELLIDVVKEFTRRATKKEGSGEASVDVLSAEDYLL